MELAKSSNFPRFRSKRGEMTPHLLSLPFSSTRTLEMGRRSTCLLPAFSALAMFLRASLRTDIFTCSCGHTRTKGNFMKATFEALKASYGYLTPDLWKPTHYTKPPFQEFTDHLQESKTVAVVL